MDTEPVIDASAIVAYVTLEENSEWVSQTIRNYRYFNILDLTYYEVSNAIKNKFREKDLNLTQAVSAFNEAKEFMELCKLHTFKEIISNTMNEVFNLNATSYDVAYLCLSKELATRFITLDTKLAEKLKGTDYCALIDYPK